MKVSITNTSSLKKVLISMIVLFGFGLWQTPVVATVIPILPVMLITVLAVFFLIAPSLRLLLRQLRQVYPDSSAILIAAGLKTAVLAVATLAALSVPSTKIAAQCSNFAVIVGEWSNSSLQRFDGTTGAYQNQLATGIGAHINSVLQYPPPNGSLFLGGYEEVHVVDAFTGASQFSFSGGPFSGLTEQIVVGLDGNAYVANEGTGAGTGSIAKYNATTGAYISTFISFPSYQPNGLAQDASGNWYIGTRNSPNTVLKYNSSGVFQGTVTTLAGGNPGGGLAVYNNELYVVNTGSTQTVRVYSLPVTSFPATPVRTLNTGGSAFVGIAFGPDNNLYLADFYNGRVTVFNPTTGALIRTITNASIPTPHGIGFTPCAPVASCAISAVSATPTPCPGSSNTYTVNGTVTFTNAPTTGTLTVTVQGGGSQVFTAPFTSPTTYSIGGLISDGVNRTVTASFSAISCTGSTTYMAPSSSAGTFNFPLNSVLGNVNYDVSPTAGQFIFNLFVPANPSPQSWTLEAFDVDYTPQGATNHATFCLEWQEDFDPNSNYQNYTVIPLENMTRGHAGEAGTASVNIPVGGIGLVRAGMIRYLFDQYYKGNAISAWSNDEAAAFQLALWEVSHEVYTSNNSFSVTTPSVNGFYTTMSSPAVTLGQSYVAAINTLNWTDAQWKSYTSTTWHVIPLENYQSMGTGYQDVITAVPKLPLVCSCTVPSAITFTQVAPTCSAAANNNNGTISLTAVTNGTHYGISTRYAGTYDGPSFASATAIPGTLPSVIKSAVPNAGGTYIVRIFNGSNTCYTDQTVTVAPVLCTCSTNQVATNYSFESGTPQVSTTIGGSDATLAVNGGAGPADIHPEGGVTYWVNAASHGGSGSINGNYLIWFPTTVAGNNNKCISWQGGNYTFNAGNCYSICYKVAAFNPNDINAGSTALIEFNDPATGWTKSFSAGGMEVTSDPSIYAVKWNLPAPSAPKDMNGNPYTGAPGQVINWKSLDWVSVCIYMTPPTTQSGISINFSSQGDAFGVTGAMALDDISVCACPSSCVAPTAITFSQVAPTCTGATANNNGTISLTGAANGTHYGVSTLGAAAYNGPAFASATAIPGSLPAIVKSGVPNSGGTYIIRIFNGANDCYTDQTVTVAPVCCLNVTSATPLCHGNGTPELATDDYITFSINVTNPLAASQYFTVTGTQAGNPIAITLSNGSPATAVNCGLKTPLRTPVGTAGHGAITLTVTDNHFGCSTTIMIADPGSCAVSCTPGTPTMVMYNYETQVDVTELVNLPIVIPQFDQQGGTRTLTAVKLDYSVGATTIALMENRAAQAQNFKVDFLTDAVIDLNGNTIASPSLKTSMPFTALGVGVLVPAQGEWPGDVTPAPPAPQVPSTIAGMEPWLSDDKLQFGKDPRTDPRWVTNATGNPATDDDMIFFPATTDVKSGTINYTVPGDLANFIGNGNVPLVVSTLSGTSSTGGGGNVSLLQRTRAYATAKVTYTYECLAACTAPSLSAVPTPVGCFGAATGAINLTVTGGTPSPFTYAWSNMANTEDISGLAAGTYTVTVTTASGGCSATTSAVVGGPASAVSVTSVPTNSTSCSPGNGAINITSSGGTPGYTYDWADIAGTSNAEDRTALGAGTYTVTVTDANGCTTSTSSIITAPSGPVVTSAVPTACAANLYNLNVVVTYSNPPSGNITVNTTAGGTVTVAQTSSPQTITLTGLVANGTANIGVTAFFVNANSCTNTLTNAYNAPAACVVCPNPNCGTATAVKN